MDGGGAFSESLRAFVEEKTKIDGTGVTCPVTFLTPSGRAVDDDESEKKSVR